MVDSNDIVSGRRSGEGEIEMNQVSCNRYWHKCTIRSSLLPIVSAPIFGFAVFRFLRNLKPEYFKLTFDMSQQTGQIESWFYMGVYLPFIVVFVLHLTRIYISIMIVDDDSEFFFHNLKPLSKGQRIWEYILRILILFSVMLFVKDTGAVIIGNSIFGITVCLYIVLLFWDISMFYLVFFAFS